MVAIVLFSYTEVLSVFKECAILFGVPLAILTIGIHWKTLFRPHMKHFETEQFLVVQNLHKALSNSKFFWIYCSPGEFNREVIDEIASELMPCFTSPFLPKNLRESLFEFLMPFCCWCFLIPAYKERKNIKEITTVPLTFE